MSNSAIVIGSGIVGLATSRALAAKGWKVKVFEKTSRPLGASIRNFGMIWPVGQPDGVLYDRAIRTREVWKQICHETNNWYNQSGSLHIAQCGEEMDVIEEVAATYADTRPIEFLSKKELVERFPSVNPTTCIGGLWSNDEMIIESRVIMNELSSYFTFKYAIEFYYNHFVSEVKPGYIKVESKKIEADLIVICSGSEFDSLYPDVFSQYFTKCKLQMMRITSQPDNYNIGPSICGGLSLIHYKSFTVAASLERLRDYYQKTHNEYLKYGIHVMVSQNQFGELTIGDSHEYGNDFTPFDSSHINILILKYLQQILVAKDWSIIQSWNGIYSKLLEPKSEFILEVDPGVWIVNGVGGAGMTLSFAFAEDFVAQL